MTKKILIVDDEPQIVTVLKAYLEKAEYKVITAYEGKSALQKFQNEKPDFLILDLNLPHIDGLELCKIIRKESDVPILILTARVEEIDRLIGLELGADDYVTKPFSPREIVARVKTIFRRLSAEPKKSGLVRFGELTIDPDQHSVKAGEQTIDLTPSEFNILLVLASQPGRVLTRLQIMEQSQGSAFEGYNRSIDAHIKNIRFKMEKDPKNPKYIKTIFGVGYKFDPEEN